jgi:cytochrome c oxidase subunit 2
MSFTVPFFPEEASSIAGEVDMMFAAWVAVSIFFTVLIFALIIYFMVRYRRRSPDEVGVYEHRGIALEVTWSVIPLLIMLVMFGWGAKLFFTQHRTPTNAVQYWGIGKQWMWKFEHPEGNREINHLHVPVGQTIEMILTSEDVIHDFSVPAFRIKQDVVPGTYTKTWFRAERVGEYHLFCDQYCGAEHSKMVGSVTVMDPRDYAVWLSGGVPGESPQLAGSRLFQSLACFTCHTISAGLPARGPSLTGVFGHQIPLEGGGTVIADEGYIRESILHPMAKIVAGFRPIMPTYEGQVSEEQLMQLVAYVKSIGGANVPPQGAGAMASPVGKISSSATPSGSTPGARPATSGATPGASHGAATSGAAGSTGANQ